MKKQSELTTIEKDALRAIKAGALFEPEAKEVKRLIRLGLVQAVPIPTIRGLRALDQEKQPA